MTITAKFASTCAVCQGAIAPGEQIEWRQGAKARHAHCAAPAPVTEGADLTTPAATRRDRVEVVEAAHALATDARTGAADAVVAALRAVRAAYAALALAERALDHATTRLVPSEPHVVSGPTGQA
jgi:hypothetical protein